jgi:glycosyltransferase involved in cell wall biosynthesis
MPGTALLHYWLTNMRGGENVLVEFCRLYPQADIFTHAWNPVTVKEPFDKHRVTETFIASLPGARRGCQKYLPLMPAALRRLDLSQYDLLISSESGPAKGVTKRSGTVHICYCHTPMRYLWDMYHEYYANAGIGGKIGMRIFRDYLRRYDLKSAEGVDHFIANSRFVAERIKRIYNRESTVIYPPCDSEYFSAVERSSGPEDYYLFVGQLIAYKRPDLAVDACRKLGRKLVIAGDGNLRRTLEESSAGDTNIQFVGRPSRDQLRKLYAGARALLFPGVEDFGIVPVEAQATGTPVIALGKGGALETIHPNKTGLFFTVETVQSLIDAIIEFETKSWDTCCIRAHAEQFNAARFRREFSRFVKTP